MDNFQAIGQLVTEARNLLDSIKGGAIRVMQNQFDALKQLILDEWNGIKYTVDNEVIAAVSRVDTQTVVNQLGFTAQNYNADFLDVVELPDNPHGLKNIYPVGMGINAGRNDYFSAEIINVESGVNASERSQEAKELLDYMGVGQKDHFSSSFNILKITVLDKSFQDLEGFDIFIPDYHLKMSPTSTFMMYFKTTGSLSVESLNIGATAGEWKQLVKHSTSSDPGQYGDLVINFENAENGDVFYIALPTITVGHFPALKKHSVLYNHKTYAIRKLKD